MPRKKSTPPPERSKLKNIALFNDEDEKQLNPNSIPLNQIKFPLSQPRRYFDSESMNHLVNSIAKDGILQPLIVRPIAKNKYELVAGERRYRACQQIGLEEVPVIIKELTDLEAQRYSLIENLQREDLNPVEETEGIISLLATHLNLNEEEVISALYKLDNQVKGKSTHNVMGKSEIDMIEQVFAEVSTMNWASFVVNRLPLLKLPEPILEALRQGKIAYTKAIAIAKVKDEQQRNLLLTEAIESKLSLQQIKERIKELQPAKAGVDTPKKRVSNVMKSLNKSKLWDKEPKKWKKISNWIDKIESLLDEK